MVALVGVRGHLSHFSLPSQEHEQEDGLQVEQPGVNGMLPSQLWPYQPQQWHPGFHLFSLPSDTLLGPSKQPLPSSQALLCAAATTRAFVQFIIATCFASTRKTIPSLHPAGLGVTPFPSETFLLLTESYAEFLTLVSLYSLPACICDS